MSDATTKTIILESEFSPPQRLPKIIQRITRRADADCLFAWELFEQIMPNDMISVIEMYADKGLPTKVIFSHAKSVMPEALRFGDPRKLEILALAIEHAVRAAAAKARKPASKR